MPKIAVAGTDETFACAADDTILRAALRSGLGMAYSCNSGSCGNCRVELEDGAVEHIRAELPAWSDRDRQRRRWLGCQSRPLGDCRIKVRLDPAYVSAHRPVRMTGRLTSIGWLTHDISEFAFVLSGPDGFRPGQYALVAPPGVDGARAYSMCNLPGESAWRFQIKRVPRGAATGILFDRLRPGDEIALDGPYGTAYLREDRDRDLLLIAGGSGLSPMISIARAASASEALAARQIHFLYACRTPSDVCGEALLQDLPGYGERLHYTAVISEPCSEDGWTGRTGMAHEAAQTLFAERLKEHEIYFAGPAAMGAAVQRAMHEVGVPRDRLHFDEFY
jgi:toluene monooxygenase electron transfer component